MAKLGTEKKPAIVRVQTEKRLQEVVAIFDQHSWKYIIGFEPDKPEDISDLEKLLNPTKPVQSTKKLGGMTHVLVVAVRSLKNAVDHRASICHYYHIATTARSRRR
jgi:hypothetical protein